MTTRANRFRSAFQVDTPDLGDGDQVTAYDAQVSTAGALVFTDQMGHALDVWAPHTWTRATRLEEDTP